MCLLRFSSYYNVIPSATGAILSLTRPCSLLGAWCSHRFGRSSVVFRRWQELALSLSLIIAPRAFMCPHDLGVFDGSRDRANVCLSTSTLDIHRCNFPQSHIMLGLISIDVFAPSAYVSLSQHLCAYLTLPAYQQHLTTLCSATAHYPSHRVEIFAYANSSIFVKCSTLCVCPLFSVLEYTW